MVSIHGGERRGTCFYAAQGIEQNIIRRDISVDDALAVEMPPNPYRSVERVRYNSTGTKENTPRSKLVFLHRVILNDVGQRATHPPP
jgi:hypothetical protein